MNKRMSQWISAGALALTLLGGLAQGAAAGTGPLPPFKPASPARFDLTGMVSVGGGVSKLAGSGTQSGDLFQQDLTITPPSGPDVTLSAIQVGMLYYFKLTGNDQWQVIDLSKTPGNVPNIQSNIPGLNGFNPNGGQRTYEAVSSATAMGTEQISGVATTKYQGDVDVKKLYMSLGVPEAQAAQVAAVSKMTLTVWVGNADMVLYQQRVVLNTKAATPNGPVDVVVDFTITYRDLGTAVTITAPANAVPYVPGGSAPAPSPTPAPAPPPSPTPAPPTGMPTTGETNPTGLFALLGFGLFCLLLGALVRRRPVARW